MHDGDLSNEAKLPRGHIVHVIELFVAEKYPGWHGRHCVCATFEYSPTEHGWHFAFVAFALTKPEGHLSHVFLFTVRKPGPHGVHVKEWFDDVVPSGQGRQTLLTT